jgi:hypothetical protein
LQPARFSRIELDRGHDQKSADDHEHHPARDEPKPAYRRHLREIGWIHQEILFEPGAVAFDHVGNAGADDGEPDQADQPAAERFAA